MGKIRSLLAGSLATVLGFSIPAHAQAPEDTGVNRSEYTMSEARREVLDRAVHVNYDNWQREVAQYDGAAIILFSTSCTQNDITRNLDVVYLGLIDKFEDTKVNGLPLKFGFYDTCGKSKADLLTVGDSIQTNMYLDGKLVDTRIDGPDDPSKIPGNTQAMSDWISSNLLGVPVISNGQEKKVIFNGQFKPQLVAYNQ